MIGPRELNTQDFLAAKADEVKDGFGFVPLIGSGLSAPSGISTIKEFRDYLEYCIRDAIAL
jgi:hypothetical protein